MAIRSVLTALSADEQANVVSTGGFLVPQRPERLVLHLYFSNPSFVAASIAFALDELTGGSKRRAVSGDVVAPAGGVATVELDLSALGLGGRKIEVAATLPLLPGFVSIHPSVNILAVAEDGSTIPVIVLTTGDFILARTVQPDSGQASSMQAPGGGPPDGTRARLRAAAADEAIGAFPNTITWGFFDVPVSPADAQTDVRVNFTNVSAQPETAVLRVFAIVNGTTPDQILRLFVTVPANGGESVVMDALDEQGVSAIEVIIDQPWAAPPAPPLPLLSPSVDVVRVAGDRVTDRLLYLAPGLTRFL